MRRARKPWYRAGKNSWYVTIDGKQVNLGVSDPNDSAGAIAAVRDLLKRIEGKAVPTALPSTVADVVSRFLADAAVRVEAKSLESYRYYLAPFAERFGAESLPLRAEPIEAWSRRPSWSQSTRHNALKTVAMVLRWAGHPVRLRIPAKTSAGAEKVVSHANYLELLRRSAGDFRQLIRFLWLTGCRPSEATRIESFHVDLNAMCVLLAEHKTVQKTGKVRTIYLCQEAAAALREQMSRYPNGGHLFLGMNRQPFTRHGLVCRFGHLAERTGVKVTAYSFRHSFACRALSQGMSDAIVAALLGHVNTAMVHRNYGHLSEQARLLRDAAERVKSA